MPSNLEIIGKNERSILVTPNLYKQDWTAPNNTTDNYSVLHTRALSDTTTPVYGKGTGVFLDTTNGGGEYDINGNPSILGSGRNNAIIINTSQWSYGPATPYSATNTRALSDATTPIYGKGTGLFLDTANGGGEYDINGNINYVGSGRNNAIGINTAQWSYGPTTPYSVTNTRALSDSTTPVYGKGTGLFLDTANGGGEYDINGHPNFLGSGRQPLMNYNYAIWTFGPSNWYTMSHPHALYPSTIPTASDILGAGDVHGKGTNDGMGLDGTLVAHTNYVGGSWDDIISRDRNIYTFGNYYWVDVTNPPNTTDWYTMAHQRALAPTTKPTASDILGAGDVHGKGTNDSTFLTPANQFTLDSHMNYGGGSWDDIISREKSILGFGNLYWVDSSSPANQTNWYRLFHPNAQAPAITPAFGALLGAGDNKGKGTLSPTILSFVNSYVLPAHTDYSGGNWDDIVSRNDNILGFGNLYWVDSSNPANFTNWYTLSNPNSQAPTTLPTPTSTLGTGDNRGKGTNDTTNLSPVNEFILPAHTNYGGGNWDDIVSRNNNINNPYNLYWVDVTSPNSPTNWYTLSNPNSQAPNPTPPTSITLLGGGDNKGKGTLSPTILNATNDYVLPAHTDYGGGSSDDIISRNNSIFRQGNLYWVDVTPSNSTTNWYTDLHPNALAPTTTPTATNTLGSGDNKGKGTNDSIGLDGIFAAHTNYKGGSWDDIIVREQSDLKNQTTVATTITVNNGTVIISGNKPFGYSYKTGNDYITTKPLYSNVANTINVGKIKWP